MEYVKYDPKQREALKKNLRRLMDERGVTKAQLSRKLGWSYNTIDYWLRGDRVPDKTGIEAICDYFGIFRRGAFRFRNEGPHVRVL